MAQVTVAQILPAAGAAGRDHLSRAMRIGWMVATIVVTQAVICAVAVAPVVFAASLILDLTRSAPAARLLLIGAAAVPGYVAFAALLMLVSAMVTRGLGWRTPAGLETRIADVEWPLLQWVRYMAATQLVRLLAGHFFRGSPIWTAYLRLAGARLGRRVYVNSLGMSDYNLLDFGDDVVIGDGAHLSGHTVERGLLKTAGVRLGRHVTIGVGSVVEIGVDAGDGCEVGALSVVPKFSRLQAHTTYAGVPVHIVARPTPGSAQVTRQGR